MSTIRILSRTIRVLIFMFLLFDLIGLSFIALINPEGWWFGEKVNGATFYETWGIILIAQIIILIIYALTRNHYKLNIITLILIIILCSIETLAGVIDIAIENTSIIFITPSFWTILLSFIAIFILIIQLKSP